MTQPSPQPEPPLQSTLAFDTERAPQSAPPPPPRPDAPLGTVWFQRISLLILVLFCLQLGVILAVLPWRTEVWDHNAFLLAHPHLWAVLRLGPVRGVISGLGLLDIWIGISEAVHYRDRKALPGQTA